MAPVPPNSPWGGWGAIEGLPQARRPRFPPPKEPQEQSPSSWGEAVEFGGVEVIVVLVVVIVMIVLFGPLGSVLKFVDCRPPLPLLMSNTLPFDEPLFTAVSSIKLLLSKAAIPPEPSGGTCLGIIPSLELTTCACGGSWPWHTGLGVGFCGQAPWLLFGFKVFGFKPTLIQGLLLSVVTMLLSEDGPHTPLVVWLLKLLLPILFDPMLG